MYVTQQLTLAKIIGVWIDNTSIWRLIHFACLDYILLYMGNKEYCQAISVTSQFIYQYTRYIDFSVYRIILKYNNQRRNKPLTFPVKPIH